MPAFPTLLHVRSGTKVPNYWVVNAGYRGGTHPFNCAGQLVSYTLPDAPSQHNGVFPGMSGKDKAFPFIWPDTHELYDLAAIFNSPNSTYLHVFIPQSACFFGFFLFFFLLGTSTLLTGHHHNNSSRAVDSPPNPVLVPAFFVGNGGCFYPCMCCFTCLHCLAADTSLQRPAAYLPQ